MPINPKTGLRETQDSFYKIPLVHQKSIGALKFGGQVTAVHQVPLGGNLTLDFYAKLGKNDELFITFMGANTRDKNFYPRFSRVKSVKDKTRAMIAFADPTLLLDSKREMLLSWYLGGPNFDPAHAILKAIKKAQGKTGARHICFIGGSGGGFAALRMSSMIPGSLAFVQDSATNISNSLPKTVSYYFKTVWPNWNKEDLLNAFPDRFDMGRHYRNISPSNYVFFTQNRSDDYFINNHYSPFRNSNGVTTDDGVSRDGKKKFVLYEGAAEGHGAITPTEFDLYFNKSLEFWRERRVDGE